MPVEAAAKRERRPPKYSADVCDRIATTQQVDTLMTSNSGSSRQRENAEPKDQRRVQLICELSALVQQLLGAVIGQKQTKQTKQTLPIGSNVTAPARNSAFPFAAPEETRSDSYYLSANKYLFSELLLSKPCEIIINYPPKLLPAEIEEMDTLQNR